MTDTANAAPTEVDVLQSPEYKKLLAETEKLVKANEKLAKKVDDLKTAIKGRETQIKNLKAKGSKGRMHMTRHQ